MSIIGDDSASTFFELEEDGQIKVKRDSELSSDTEIKYTVRKREKYLPCSAFSMVNHVHCGVFIWVVWLVEFWELPCLKEQIDYLI